MSHFYKLVIKAVNVLHDKQSYFICLRINICLPDTSPRPIFHSVIQCSQIKEGVYTITKLLFVTHSKISIFESLCMRHLNIKKCSGKMSDKEM